METISELGQEVPERNSRFRFFQPRFLRQRRCTIRKIVRISWAVFSAAILLGSVPILLWEYGTNLQSYCFPVSSIFCILAVPASFYGIYRHIANYWQPILQQYVVRILWMVPIYSLCSWTAVLFYLYDLNDYAYIPEAIRDCYESYTLYNFFTYMLVFLEIHYGKSPTKVIQESHPTEEAVPHLPPLRLVIPYPKTIHHATPCCRRDPAASSQTGRGWGAHAALLDTKPESGAAEVVNVGVVADTADDDDDGVDTNTASAGAVPATGLNYPPPPLAQSAAHPRRKCLTLGTVVLNLVPNWKLDGEFVRKCRFGVLIYVAMEPFNAMITVLLSGANLASSMTVWNIVHSATLTIASSWAVYCLVLFYHAAAHDLEPTKPLAKFLVVKGVVFFTFAQNILISMYFSYISSYSDEETTRMTGIFTNALMCVEMLFFAVAQVYAFPHSQYRRVTHETMTSESQQWLVEWGNFYAAQRGAYMREGAHNMVSVRDVHHDTREVWQTVRTALMENRAEPQEAATAAQDERVAASTAEGSIN